MTSDIQDRPLWRRIADFPLVAMVIAVALLVGTVWLAGKGIRQLPYWGIPDASRQMIAGLGGRRDWSLRSINWRSASWANSRATICGASIAVRDLALGLGGGALLFSLVTLVAALVGVYDIVGWGSTRSILYVAGDDRDHPRGDGGVAVSRNPVPPSRGFRRQLVRAGADLGIVRGSAYLQPQCDRLFIVRDRGRSGDAARRGLYADASSLWAPIGLHAAWNFTQGQVLRRSGVGARPGLGWSRRNCRGRNCCRAGRSGSKRRSSRWLIATGRGAVAGRARGPRRACGPPVVGAAAV